jgi:hypothetical protein
MLPPLIGVCFVMRAPGALVPPIVNARSRKPDDHRTRYCTDTAARRKQLAREREQFDHLIAAIQRLSKRPETSWAD